MATANIVGVLTLMPKDVVWDIVIPTEPSAFVTQFVDGGAVV
jgi:hypothetical protein